MPIKSDNFGRTVLSGDDAVQFINHMKNDKPNEKAKAALARGRQVLARLKNKTSWCWRQSRQTKAYLK